MDQNDSLGPKRTRRATRSLEAYHALRALNGHPKLKLKKFSHPLTPDQKKWLDHHRALWSRFRLGRPTYDRILAFQDRVCAICKRPETASNGRRLSLDHDPVTGAVRGALCSICNLRLGGLSREDTISWLYRAFEYVNLNLDWRIGAENDDKTAPPGNSFTLLT